jgi:CRP-like cAMP-binding protein
MRSATPTQLLGNVWLFERCSRSELAVIARSATTVDVPAGKVLAREGDTGREFFVIKSGSVEASRAGRRIGTLGPGNFFGEMALLERQPRAATIAAMEPCSLLVLTGREFTSIVDTMPSVDRKIMAVLREPGPRARRPIPPRGTNRRTQGPKLGRRNRVTRRRDAQHLDALEHARRGPK